MKKVKDLRYKRTLYVGLGGAGAQTLSLLKKKILDANGDQLPSQVGFLLIDTNATDLLNNKDFDCSEKICIAVREPYERYKHDLGKRTHEYIPPKNKQSLLALERGAGQIRSNGHFAVIENQYSDRLLRVFRSAADNLEDIDIDGETLERDPKIEVRLVFSIAGGTGSGTFLPIATLIRKAIKQCELIAYIYSATIYEKFVENSAKYSVMQNAYAALCELDYMMHFGMDDRKYENIKFNFGPHINQQIEQSNRPFEEVYYIDKNTALPYSDSVEFCYNLKERMQDNTADAIHLASTNLISSHTGTVDNVRQKIMEGQFNVGNKFAWVSGFGMAELSFNAAGLEAKKHCCDIIDARIAENDWSDSKINSLAQKFIEDFRWDESLGKGDNDPVLEQFITETLIRKICQDKAERENNLTDPDLHIDFDKILSLATKKSKEEVVEYLSQKFDKDVLKFVTELIDKDQYKGDKVSSNPYGISLKTILAILQAIDARLSKSIQKLTSEESQQGTDKTNGEKELNMLHTQPDNSVDYATKFRRMQAENAINSILQERTNAAIEVFEKAKDLIQSYEEIYNAWFNLLSSARGSDVAKIVENNKNSNKKLQSKKNLVEVKMSDFNGNFRLNYNSMESLKSLKDQNDILYDNDTFNKILDMNGDALGSLRTYLLKESGHRKDKNNSNKTVCQTKLERLIDLSTPTMQVDRHGYGSRVKVDQFWYILASTNIPEIEENHDENAPTDGTNQSIADLLKDLLEQNILDDHVNIIPVDDWNNKAILYRVKSAVPAYFVQGVCGDGHTLEGCYEELKKTNLTYTPFSHEILRQKMENEICVMKPFDETDDDEAMSNWVNFQILSQSSNEYFVFEETKNTEGIYSISSSVVGEYLTPDLDDRTKILILGESRAEAYNNFRRYCKALIEERKEYKDITDSIEHPEEYQNTFVLGGEEYMDKVIPGWREMHISEKHPDHDLIRREMDYMDRRKKQFLEDKAKYDAKKRLVAKHNVKN